MSSLIERLRKHVDVLAELIGERNTAHPHGLDATRAYLRRELTEMGFVAISEQIFATSRRPAINFEVRVAGTRPDLLPLVVGAHYDSAVGTPGADDNASAVAILLEIARALVATKLRRSLRIVFYDCEEQPHFLVGEMGSQFHAAEIARAGEKIHGMICLESLGYFPRRVGTPPGSPWPLRLMNRLLGGRHVVVASNVRSFRFWLRFVAYFLTSGFFPTLPAAMPVKWVPAIELSDHRGYWEHGFPALMVTDTAFLRNPNYHLPTDRLATLDLDRMERLCRQLTRAVRRMCR
jgi:hypothetical protein